MAVATSNGSAAQHQYSAQELANWKLLLSPPPKRATAMMLEPGSTASIDLVVAAVGSQLLEFSAQLAASKCVSLFSRRFAYVGCGSVRKRYTGSEHAKEVDQSWNFQERLQSLQMAFNSTNVVEVPNSWSRTEASAYFMHITLHYDSLADRTVFVHSHMISWHSAPLCSALYSRSAHHAGGYASLNLGTKRLCVSAHSVRSNFNESSVALERFRDATFSLWSRWTGSSPPERITSVCCAQFVATRAALVQRPLLAWTRLLRATAFDNAAGWEYLWPALVDENAQAASDSC